MKDRMIRKNELEFLRAVRTGIHGPFNFKTKFPKRTSDYRGDAVDQEQDTATVGKIPPKEFARVGRLKIAAFDTKDVGVLIGSEFLGQPCWFDDPGGPLPFHNVRRERQSLIVGRR